MFCVEDIYFYQKISNKYFLLEKNVIDTKNYVYYSQGGTEEPANYSREHGNMPNKQGKPCLEGVSFCGER